MRRAAAAFILIIPFFMATRANAGPFGASGCGIRSWDKNACKRSAIVRPDRDSLTCSPLLPPQSRIDGGTEDVPGEVHQRVGQLRVDLHRRHARVMEGPFRIIRNNAARIKYPPETAK